MTRTSEIKKRIVGLLVLACVLIPLLLVALAPREPVYQGKRLSEWLPQFLTRNPSSAEAAVQQMGTAVIPFLERKIHAEFSFRREAYRALWPNLPPVVRQCLAPPTDLNDLWTEAIRSLKALGPSALPAMSDWLRRRDPRVRLAAILVIRGTNPASWPNRAQIVHGLDQTIRPNAPGFRQNAGLAASVLGSVGAEAREAVPQLTALLDSEIPNTRAEAAVALWRIQRDTNLVVLLARELRGAWPGSAIYGEIITAFGDMGEGAKRAVPLILATGSNAPLVASPGMPITREMVFKALTKIDPVKAKPLEPTGGVRSVR